jgi:hypothetical protein
VGHLELRTLLSGFEFLDSLPQSGEFSAELGEFNR